MVAGCNPELGTVLAGGPCTCLSTAEVLTPGATKFAPDGRNPTLTGLAAWCLLLLLLVVVV
jgi:hypothetical protein